jgi:uncharacterized Ntn-hydrolase superfamily protein
MTFSIVVRIGDAYGVALLAAGTSAVATAARLTALDQGREDRRLGVREAAA